MEVDEVSNETSDNLSNETSDKELPKETSDKELPKETQQDVEMNEADEEQSQDTVAEAKDVEDEAEQGEDESGKNIDKDKDDPCVDDEGADSTSAVANTTNIDESMEQDELDRPEQVNMENLADTTTIDKDKSISEDPFDSVKHSKNHSAESTSELRQDNEELDADDDHDRDDTVNESAADGIDIIFIFKS